MENKSSNDGDEREFIERRLNELDRRRDQNLQSKLDAIEKLFNLSVSTKSEALNLAISRIQGDNKDCMIRCSNQVKSFHLMIRTIREKVLVQVMTTDALKSEIASVKNDTVSLISDFDVFKNDMNTYKMAKSQELLNLNAAITEQSKDLQRIPLKVLIITALIGVGVFEVLFKLLRWLYKAAMSNGGFGV